MARWTKTPKERFMDKVEKTDSCWEWTGYKKADGMMSRQGRGPGNAHRIGYELFVGPIPEGFQIDHLCRNPGCVNPAHLEAVTQRENGLRGISPAAEHAKQTRCIRGHELTGSNLRLTRKGGRQCVICTRYRTRRRDLRSGGLTFERFSELMSAEPGWSDGVFDYDAPVGPYKRKEKKTT